MYKHARSYFEFLNIEEVQPVDVKSHIIRLISQSRVQAKCNEEQISLRGFNGRIVCCVAPVISQTQYVCKRKYLSNRMVI